MDIADILQTALVPMVIISASGLLSLSIQQRYGRVIDRIRYFHEQLILNPEDKWKFIILEQRDILITRGKLLRNALSFLMTSVLCAVLTIAALSISLVSYNLNKLALFLFALSLSSLFISILFFIREIFNSYNAVLREDEKIRKA